MKAAAVIRYPSSNGCSAAVERLQKHCAVCKAMLWFLRQTSVNECRSGRSDIRT
jgi:hypothetical protein